MHDHSDNPARAIVWKHGVLSVESLGGMLGPTAFVLPDGRQVSPFQIAPWAQEQSSEPLPGILQRLRGEWVEQVGAASRTSSWRQKARSKGEALRRQACCARA